MSHARLSSKNWFGKASAGVILGFILTIGLTGLILKFSFGEIHPFSPRGQFLMWIVSPLWACVISFSFLFQSGRQAWLYLTVISLLIWMGVYSSDFVRAA